MKEPLAYRMRPNHLDEIIGQQHLIAPGSVLRSCVEKKQLYSMIFYGAPGMGKTTLAVVLANERCKWYKKRIRFAFFGSKDVSWFCFDH